MEKCLNGKKVLFMGDSITALYMGHNGWPKYFCEMLEPMQHACIAVSGARWCDNPNTVYDGNPASVDGDNTNNTMGNQIERLKRARAAGEEQFADFDVIIMAAGSNDRAPESDEVCDAQFFRDGEYVPLENADRKTWGGSIRYVSESLYEMYPNATQFICGPVQADDNVRSFRSILEKGEFLHTVCARLSVHFIDTIHCGIYGRYEKWGSCGRSLCDGLHPNDTGARQMAKYIAAAVKSILE